MNPAAVRGDTVEGLHEFFALPLHEGAPDAALAAIARLASLHSGCAVGAVGLLDAARLRWLASTHPELPDLTREFACCSATEPDAAVCTVADTRLDPRASALLALQPPILFYAAVPVSVCGQHVGCVCVVDHEPRSLAPAQKLALQELALLCGELLGARLQALPERSTGPDESALAARLANRAKSEFLSRVSHEMRTPLNAVIGFTQLLRLSPEGHTPAQVAQYTEHVLRASEQLLKLINDLLDLQRVDEGRLALELQPQSLNALIGATFELLQPLAAEHGVALQNAVDGEPWVVADAQRLRQVMLNLVTNAIRYNKAGGWARLALAPGDSNEWLLVVEDSGGGLSPAQLARLVQPFERLGQESSGIAGSGLGLVIACRLVEGMGGRLSLSSVPGAGTRVCVALPRAAAPAAVGARNPVQPVPASAFGPALPSLPLRVLYVEDNRINAILFEEAVRLRGGIELQVAEDGAEALVLVQRWQPEVLVLDAHLPDMSGYDVLLRLRALPGLAAVPAFMCSADAMEEDLQRADSAGFVGYWTKPIDLVRVMGDLEPLLQRAAAA